jgi:formylglycine-generating enzyme required for sulfatase activity
MLEPFFTNSIGMEFILIPAGSFMMGSADSDPDPWCNEKPAHKVTISKPFYLGKYAVTQEPWTAVMGNNPSMYEGLSNPVEMVSWNKTQKFIKRLNQKEGHDRYRLPT